MSDMTELGPKMDEAARLMQMLSTPVRLHLLCLLLDGEKSVQTLVGQLGMSQPAVSHHLKLLREAGLVKTRRDAQTIYNSLNGAEVETVLNTLHGIYCT
ncbi:ArsR/SmtB family transcription factor [Pseudogemmobacter sp. W21_MBD1_M6]|uniref:ArsR/SmtB family transcription factor n=1 Tax=Pseudogemmobacter sp. W21_MBD1_M6 TaxID=3240271 RepID=UPI003F9C454C